MNLSLTDEYQIFTRNEKPRSRRRPIVSSFYSRTWNRLVDGPLDASIWLLPEPVSLYDISERGDSFLGFPQARTISIRRASRASTLPSMEILGDLPELRLYHAGRSHPRYAYAPQQVNLIVTQRENCDHFLGKHRKALSTYSRKILMVIHPTPPIAWQPFWRESYPRGWTPTRIYPW